MIACDKIIYIMNIALIKITNATSTVSINCYNKKVTYKIDCYILHAVLLVIKLPLIITTIYCHYAKQRSKQKGIDELTAYKWRIMNFQKFVLKIVRVIISMT